MGLDCTAYSHLTHVSPAQHGPIDPDEGYCEDDEHVTAFAYDGFQRSIRGLRGMDKAYGGPGLIGGDCYAETEDTECFGWRAGSYGYYMRYREELARIAGSDFSQYGPGAEHLPFFEQIWFADNEGTIGPEAAKDLLEDYHRFRPQAQQHFANAPDDMESYDEWITALELAAQDGLIAFH